MSQVTRRRFLQLAGIVLLGAGCSPAIDLALRPTLPDSRLFEGEHQQILHLLNRATFGPRPGQIQQVAGMGLETWLEQQLAYENITDTNLELRLRRYDTLAMQPQDLLSFGRLPDKRFVANQLASATLLRATFSQRQLYEVLVNFWSDHFSIYHFKDGVTVLKTVDDREVIRPHALGSFRDMLTASAHSPAMLVYLDNVINEKSHPNENYAREIMELHTLGVDGGYTEQDVVEVARCFTGWSVNDRGHFEFRPEWHDEGQKQVLGQTIAAGGGKSDGDRVLEILLNHPSTPRFVCRKLAQRFVSDPPPEAIIAACVQTWEATDGNIREGMRTLLNHDDFWSAGPRFKRPLEMAISLLRVSNATYNGSNNLLNALNDMGQRPFNWTTPDGYPDSDAIWYGNLLDRWNFVIAVVHGRIPGIRLPIAELTQRARAASVAPLDFLGQVVLQRPFTSEEREALSNIFANTISQDNLNQYDTRNLLSAVLASPAFQWR